MKKIIYTISIALLLIIAFSLLTDNRQRTKAKMGTFVTVKLFGFKWYDFNSAFEKAFSSIDDVDNIANMYEADSEVSRLNRAASEEPVKVSNGLFLLIKDSKAMYKDSAGSFDITVAPLVELWMPYAGRDSIPAKEAVEKTLSLIGSDNIILDEEEQSVFFKKKGMKIDLSAIAKGYAVDKAIEAIKACGFNSALVNAGGDISCLGRKDFFFLWRIGIQDPRNKDRLFKVLRILDKAVATSGGYEQYFAYKNKDYTHLIHPKTGYPVESVFSSTTVIANRCFLADAVATAVSVGGREVSDRLKRLYPDIEIIQIFS